MLLRFAVKAFCFKGLLILATAVTGWSLGLRWCLFSFVYGNSMEPALHSGQFLRLNHAVRRQIPRGAIVVIEQFGRMPLIKRVIGVPGETVSFQLGEVFINGKMLRESYIPYESTTFSWKYDLLRTGDDEYVVLGDNRLSSVDSRDYGPVPRSWIIAVIDSNDTQSELLPQPWFRITKHHQATELSPRPKLPLQRGPT